MLEIPGNDIVDNKKNKQQQERKKLDKLELDESGNYSKPTEDQKEKFSTALRELSEIFENANFPWYLDGAMNISIYLGDQIRQHKDIDISIFKEDLGKLNNLLKGKGFGVFIISEEGNKQMLRLLDVEELLKLASYHLCIKKIDSNGIIQDREDSLFSNVDLHVHDRDENGNTIINYSGSKFSKEYFKQIQHELPNNKTINLSHPAIVFYHKLYAYDKINRPYDLLDLEKLAPKLETKDFEMLRGVVESEFEKRIDQIRQVFESLWQFLTPILELSKDGATIKQKLLQHSEITKKINIKDQKTIDYVDIISQYISENSNISKEDFINKSLEITKPLEWLQERMKILMDLEKIKLNG